MELSKNIKLLAIFNFLTDFDLLAPVAAIYFAKVTGSYALGMSVFSIVFISQAIFEVPTGVLSDKVGRKNTIVFGAFCSFIASLFLAIGGTYIFLIISAIFAGLARSFWSGNNNAFLYDTLKDQGQECNYHEYLGKTSSMFQLALATSALLGGFIANVSYIYLLWFAVIPNVVKLLTSLNFTEPKSYTKAETNIYSHVKESIKNTWNNLRLRKLSLASIIDFSLGESSYQFQTVFINTLWPTWALGIAKSLSNILAFISFYFSGKIIKKYQELKILVIGNTSNRLIYIFAIVFPSIISPILISSTSLFFGVDEVSKGHLMQKEFTDQQRATMGSITAFLSSIAFAIVSFTVGLFADIISPSKSLLVIQILSFASIFIYYQLFRSIKMCKNEKTQPYGNEPIYSR